VGCEGRGVQFYFVKTFEERLCESILLSFLVKEIKRILSGG